MRCTATHLSLIIVAALVVSAVPLGAAEPTPGLGCRAAEAGAPVPRIVPEAEYALDYISFDEWKVCLGLIEKAAPQYVSVKEVAKSPGWPQAGGGAKRQSPVYWVEVTNEASPIPFEHRLKNLFVLSIHGNEKGGREGGMRTIEDLARGIGIAQEYPDLRKFLDYQVQVFVFANPDGWTHEELGAYASSPNSQLGGGGYTRHNANGVDLNRQWPNHGWSDTGRKGLSQPEIAAVANLIKNYTNWFSGTDIHGMGQPSDGRPGENTAVLQGRTGNPGGSLLMGMLSAGQSDPLKMLKTTRLAELLKERVDKDPQLREWSAAPNTGLWGGEVMHWGTSWDTIGYVDSGFTGDFIFQPHGMDAVDIDFELSYNHDVTNNHYAGLGMELNRLHVRAVRQIVAVFMSAANDDVQMSYETKGLKTAYLYNPRLVTSLDGGPTDRLEGWAAENPLDDRFDFGHNPYNASANDYFDAVRPFVRNGDKPGVLDPLRVDELTPAALAGFDNLVIAGSSGAQLSNRPEALEAVWAWTKAGGTLVLTDESLQLLEGAGIVASGKVAKLLDTTGHTNFVDRTSPIAAGLRGLARQTYEPIPLGYPRLRAAPNWYVERAAWESGGGKTIGALPMTPAGGAGLPLQGTTPAALPAANLGEMALGKGRVRILGALLPDPIEEHYHPYGLDGFATTYTGNLLFRNLLGWDETFKAPPVVVENLGKARPIASDGGAAGAKTSDGSGVPGFGLGLLLAAALLAVAWGRRARL
ncbi:MAG: hypothetical protein HYT80_10595 [Euryarchaeota archaeon]|nr:hypothetical protein [Euryarchaeota archaeon]